MSITKSYNKQTGIYYAYETTYEWSEEKQKKVQRKKCIGQFDPKTGEVIPNGKVGRPSLLSQKTSAYKNSSTPIEPLSISNNEIAKIISRLEVLDTKTNAILSEISELIKDLKSIT